MRSERRTQLVAVAVVLGGVVALIALCAGMLFLPFLGFRGWSVAG